MLESMTGKRDSVADSMRDSVSNDVYGTTDTIDERNMLSPSTLDNIHPIFENEKSRPNILNSFREVTPAYNGKHEVTKHLSDDEDYDHILPFSEGAIVFKSLHDSPDEISLHSQFFPVSANYENDDYDHIPPIQHRNLRQMKPVSSSCSALSTMGTNTSAERGSFRNMRLRAVASRRDLEEHSVDFRRGIVYNVSAEMLNMQNIDSSSADSGDFPVSDIITNCSIGQKNLIINSSRTNSRNRS